LLAQAEQGELDTQWICARRWSHGTPHHLSLCPSLSPRSSNHPDGQPWPFPLFLAPLIHPSLPVFFLRCGSFGASKFSSTVQVRLPVAPLLHPPAWHSPRLRV
jgi:hypothetical protein